MPLNKMACESCGHTALEMRTPDECPKCHAKEYKKQFPKNLTTGRVDKSGQMASLHIQETKEQIKELRKEKW